MKDYYEDLDLKYPEIAIAAEDFYTTQSSAKFYIPVLMPLVTNTTRINQQNFPNNMNILNKDKPQISKSASTTGYITIPIHRERMGEWYHREQHNLVPKGAKFIVIFVGGDINKPRILGRY